MATYPQVYESAVKEDNLQGEGYVQLEWNDTGSTPIPAGEVCPLDSNFVLFSKHWPSQTSAYGWRYSPKYQHRLAQLAYLPCYFKLKDADNNDVTLSTYPYTGDAATIAQHIVNCLKDHGDLGNGWTVGSIGVSGTKSMQFDGDTIKSAAQKIADAWETEFFFNWADKTFNIGAVAAPQGAATPEYNAGTLVSASDGGIQYNCFRILGGTRNMSKKSISGQNVAVTERLMLDPEDYPGSIIDKRSGAEPKIMKDVVFDGVFPKMELFIYDVRERPCYLCDEEGNKIPDAYELDAGGNRVIDPETGLPKVAIDPVTGQPRYKRYSKWYFKLAYYDGEQMQPYEYDTNLGIADLPLSLVFQMNDRTGAADQPLIAREFEVVYYDNQNPDPEHGNDDVSSQWFQPEHGDFRIIFSVQNDLILPSTSTDGLCPYEHDTTNHQPSLLSNTVTLTNVAMDDVYIAAAQKELAEKGEAAANIESRDKSSFTYQTYGTAPTLGSAVSGGIVSSVREDLITHEIQYTVGHYQSSKSLIGRLSDKIEAATAGSGKATTNSGNPTTGGTTTVIQGGVPEDSIPVISQLAGVNSLRIGVERVRDLMGTKGILALTAILLYDSIKDKMPVSCVFGSGSSGITPGTYSITYNNGTLTTTGGIVLPASVTDYADLLTYFAATHEILGNYTFTIYGTVNEQATYNMYDLWVKSVAVPKVHTASGNNAGIEVYIWNGEEWEMIREYVRTLIENLGDEIRLIVYGSNYQGQQASGIVVTMGQLEAFSEKFTTDPQTGEITGVGRSSLVLTSESGVLSTDYYDAQGNRVTGASIATQVYSCQEEGQTKYRSRLLLNADNVAISGECITIGTTDPQTGQVTPTAVFTNGKITASLIDVDTLAASLVNTQTLNAKYATITSLEALAATVGEISADVITVNDVLTAPEFVTSVISAVEGGNITVVNSSQQETFKITQAGDVTIRGTVNADSGYFKGELQGATGTFSGSLTSNDNKVLLTSTRMSGWGFQYTWRGFAVSNNGFISGDLATIGARIDDGGYDYGRIALVKRATGQSSSQSQIHDYDIILDASDGSISGANVTATQIKPTGRLLMATAVIGHTLNEFTPSSSGNTIPISQGNKVTINGNHDTVFLPTLDSCRSSLNVNSNTHFAIDLIVMAATGTSFKVYGYIDSSHGEDCPHIRSNNYDDTTNGISMAQGDVLHFVIVYDGSFNAFIISHRN